MTRTCPNCGSSEIDDDSARGDSSCMNCGTVLEESTIVSDVAFQENSGGGHSLVGQFVSKDRGQHNNLSGVPGLSQQESREITYYKGRKLIEEIASQLRINQHCVNTAFNFFKMCVSRNFTRGRVRSHVVAACLYMTCRLENTAHLLLDFSDITQVNVFDLGRTLNFLARSLKINLPTTDPCMYILRFAVLLDFGAKQKEVVSLATRLVQRMKRDWIATGRRPTGLCGAALLLAARCYNFNRTIADVVRIVHVSEAVVRKRLDEFGQTPSSTLTIDEFTTIDLEHCEDPPAFRESRRKARELQLQKEEEALKKIESEMQPMEAEVERALEKRRKERFKRTHYAKMISGSLSAESDELSPADAVVRNEIVDLVFSAAVDTMPFADAGMSSTYAPSLASLGIAPVKNQTKPVDELKLEKHTCNGELDLEGIDEDEIDAYILTEEEVVLKTRFWMKLNGDHLEEMERRRREKEEEEEREKDNPAKKRRRTNGVRKKEPIVAATAQEAMEKEKKLSNKINYDILKEIEDADETIVKSEQHVSGIAPKEEIGEVTDNSNFHQSSKHSSSGTMQSLNEKEDITLRTDRVSKTRKRVRPNISFATKKAVEQTISAMSVSNAAAGSVEDTCKEVNESSVKSESGVNKKSRPVRLMSSISQSARNPDVLVVTKTDGLISEQSASLVQTESNRAAEFHEDLKEVSSTRGQEQPKELICKVSEPTDFCSSGNVGAEELSGSSLKEQSTIKSRYTKMRPNLNSFKPPKSLHTQNGDNGTSTELSVALVGEEQEEKQNMRICRIPQNLEAEAADSKKSVKDAVVQESAKTDCTPNANKNTQLTKGTRNRYLKAKPNLNSQSRKAKIETGVD